MQKPRIQGKYRKFSERTPVWRAMGKIRMRLEEIYKEDL
jgi:hypothetical protein